MVGLGKFGRLLSPIIRFFSRSSGTGMKATDAATKLTTAGSGMSRVGGAIAGGAAASALGAGTVASGAYVIQLGVQGELQDDERDRIKNTHESQREALRMATQGYEQLLQEWRQAGFFTRLSKWFSATFFGEKNIYTELAEAREFLEGTKTVNEAGEVVFTESGLNRAMASIEQSQVDALNAAELQDPGIEAFNKVFSSPETGTAMAGGAALAGATGAGLGAILLGKGGTPPVDKTRPGATLHGAGRGLGAADDVGRGAARAAASSADVAAKVGGKFWSRMARRGKLGLAVAAVGGGLTYLLAGADEAQAAVPPTEAGIDPVSFDTRASIANAQTSDLSVPADVQADESLITVGADVAASIGIASLTTAGIVATTGLGAGATILSAPALAVGAAADFAQAGVMTGVDALRGKDVSLKSFWDRTFTGSAVNLASEGLSYAFSSEASEDPSSNITMSTAEARRAARHGVRPEFAPAG